MLDFSLEVAFPIPSELGEGAIWDDRLGVLYWVDITGNKVHRYDPRNRSNLSYDVGESVGTVVPSLDAGLLLGCRSGIAWLDPDTGEVHPLLALESDKPHTRLNDGKCDPVGRFWVGSICEREPRFDGGLYCVDTDLTTEQKLSAIQCSNGLVWTGDARTFYYIDTPTHEVWGFDYDLGSGSISRRRTVARVEDAQLSPDGMAIDSDDHLWIALNHGHRIVRVDPASGKTEFEIPVPVTNVTSVAFGGEKLDELYITTARVGLKPEILAKEPLAGSLFRVRVPFHGVKCNRFGRELSRIKTSNVP
jgi:sugar lactone lactonase YvrE